MVQNVVVVKIMKLINHIKEILGIYYINEFEKVILTCVEQRLTSQSLVAWKDQFKRFNRVERILVDDDRLKCGSTSFYWIKSGKSQIDFPIKFNYEKDEEKLAELEIQNRDNNIKVIFQIVKGALFRIEYYSESRLFQPKGEYKITSINVYK